MKTKSTHIIFIGFHQSLLEAIDFKKYDVSIIIHDFLNKNLDSKIKKKFLEIGVIDVPHNMNLEEYLSAMPEIEKRVEEIISKHGIPKAFIAPYEHATLPAAILREKYNVQGTSVATATLCRNKVKMKAFLRNKGISCPLFMELRQDTPKESIKDFCSSINSKIVLKPQSQAASEGISIFNTSEEALDYFNKNGIPNNYEIEEFIDGTLYHFDGVIREKEIIFFSASEYSTNCYNYVYKKIPMASIIVDDKDKFNKFYNFTKKILREINLENGVFHLEAFLKPDESLIFLEIANRFGGAGVVPLIKTVYGVNLAKELILSDVLESSEIKSPIKTIDFAFSSAWLYIPIPTNVKCVVKSVQDVVELLPKSVVSYTIVKVGQYLNDVLMPFPSLGQFFIKSKSSKSIKEDCSLILEHFKVELLYDS
jgi:carbamoylphosphate synthase large subunit